MWEQTKTWAGISRSAFRAYFEGVDAAIAISLRRVFKLKKELKPTEVKSGFRVPRSFSYVDSSFFNRVVEVGLDASDR